MKITVSNESPSSVVSTKALTFGEVYRFGKYIVIPDSDEGGLLIDLEVPTFICASNIESYLYEYHDTKHVQLTTEKVAMTIS